MSPRILSHLAHLGPLGWAPRRRRLLLLLAPPALAAAALAALVVYRPPGSAPGPGPGVAPSVAAVLGRPAHTAAGTGQRSVSTVSLNSASADQLAAIPGFSAELAAAAVAYRTQYGGFASTRELVTVLQMSDADYQLAKRYVRI